jgi:hypothetical protein
VDGTQLKARLRKGGRHFNETNFADAEAVFLNVADSGFCPDMIDRQQEYDVVCHGHGMLKKWANLAPGWICDYPINAGFPVEKITALLDLAPGGSWHATKEMTFAFAGFENLTAWFEVRDNALSQFGRRLHNIVADVITIGLVSHSDCLRGTRKKYKLFFWESLSGEAVGSTIRTKIPS